MTVGGRYTSVTRCRSIRSSNSFKSIRFITTTVPPRAVHGSVRVPAAWVIGAATRFTIGSALRDGAANSGCSALTDRLRCVFIAPFGGPVVPPVGRIAATDAWSGTYSGSSLLADSINDASELTSGVDAASSVSPSAITVCNWVSSPRILLATGNSRSWQNSTSQSKPANKRWISSGGLAGLTGTQAIPALHSPRTQAHANGSLPASTAPFASRPTPQLSNALPTRQDSSPISV